MRPKNLKSRPLFMKFSDLTFLASRSCSNCSMKVSKTVTPNSARSSSCLGHNVHSRNFRQLILSSFCMSLKQQIIHVFIFSARMTIWASMALRIPGAVPWSRWLQLKETSVESALACVIRCKRTQSNSCWCLYSIRNLIQSGT